MSATWQNMLNSLGSWSLKALGCVAILVVGWIIAGILGRVVDKVLAKVGFNRLAERTGFRRWTGKYEPSALIGKLVYYTAVLFTLQIGFNVFGPNPVSSLIDTIISWLPRLLVACVIVVVAIAIANAVFDVITNALSQFSYGKTLGRVAQIAIIALATIAALNQIGVATSVTMPLLIAALATVAGIAIVGVGGGMIKPMQARWERMLDKAEAEGSKVAATLKSGSTTDSMQPGYSPSGMVRDTKEAAKETIRNAAPKVEH